MKNPKQCFGFFYGNIQREAKIKKFTYFLGIFYNKKIDINETKYYTKKIVLWGY